MIGYFLGLDTSNYKTSIAVTDCSGDIIYQKSELLPVKPGQRGLRQETALFMHDTRLPDYLREAFEVIEPRDILAIGVSYAPRRAEGSYMPVFTAGLNTARILSSALKIPVYEFSHQEGHIEAIMIGEEIELGKEFLQFHLSGGTSEGLRCKPLHSGYECEIVGGTKDINIGQLIDRVGVKLGHEFPAGRFLDEIACRDNISFIPKKVKTNNGYFNLSGIETEVMRATETYGTGVVPGLFMRISELMSEEIAFLANAYGLHDAYIAGGVASSSYLRRYISDHPVKDVNIHFGDPLLSGDNAVGISILGSKAYFNENSNRNPDK